MRVTCLCLFAVVAALVTESATSSARQGGAVRGRVLVPDRPAVAGRPAISDLASTAHVPVDRRRVVVYLEAAPRQAFDELRPGRARMDQRDEQFMPRVLAVTVGTTVDFPNNDKTFHNVFSLSRVRAFNLGRFAPGRTGAVRFDRPGIVPVFCDIHSPMSAYILVFSHPFFSVSDEAGRYEITGIPSGAYTLVVWSELGQAAPRRIAIADGGIVEADFQVAHDP